MRFLAVFHDSRRSCRHGCILLFSQHGGPVGSVPDTRELVISTSPFVVAYRIQKERIVILAIYHGAQQRPEEFQASEVARL